MSYSSQVCQKVFLCVTRLSDVSEGRQVCEKAISCVNRSPGVSEYCKVVVFYDFIS